MLFAALTVAILIAIVTLVGLMLPRRHIVIRHALYRESPETVFAIITGPENWRPELRKWEQLPNAGGQRRWREYPKHGRPVTLEQTASDPPRMYQAVIADKSLPFIGTWTWELTPSGNGCDLRMTENGEVHNPIFRFIGRFIIGYDRTITDYLNALGKKFGESVTVQQ